MAIVLEKLIARGLDQEDAILEFTAHNCLIRGPSDTGKSYIRDCLWYLLGGDKVPKPVPEAFGYQTISLEFTSDGDRYLVERALAGGSAAIYKEYLQVEKDKAGEIPLSRDPVRANLQSINEDLSELIVKLSGAAEKKLLRSKSKKGDVTGTDLRHWFLLSQPTVISEDPTSGASHSERPQRIAAFHLFLTGNDDSAIELSKSKAEKDRITGELTSAQNALKRTLADIPVDTNRTEVEDALTRVDNTLTEMARQYEGRAANLQQIRRQIVTTTESLQLEASRANHSAAMVERFKLLAAKYDSDLQRLGAVNEGVAYFQALEETPCPLCGTVFAKHGAQSHPHIKKSEKYRIAVAAEANKIRSLRLGLLQSLEREENRLLHSDSAARTLSEELKALAQQEAQHLSGARIEFAADPKTMAVRRSELSAILKLFDETEHLKNEIERLKNSKISRTAPVSREAGKAAIDVSDIAKTMLHAWGFSDITSVRLDSDECDLHINNRSRLSYGAGKRGLFLTALTIALMEHALRQDFPHLGVVVIDSPLKAYADLDSTVGEIGVQTVPLATVKDKFYDWLADRKGLGQIIILENEKISDDTAARLKPIQFTRRNDFGRAGFYLRSVSPLEAD